jgi:DNA-binding response OmpR family regulator
MTGGPGQHVLVVDDDASIRLLCRINLELEGWSVREASTLAEARRQLADGDVSVILLDVHVGQDSGVRFLEELRSERPGTPVAMLTGSAESPEVEAIGADAVVAKPFTLEELAATVRTLAEGRGIESPPS